MMHLWHHENVQFNIYRRILNSVSHLKTKRPSYNYNKYEEKTMKPKECSFSFHFFAKKLFTLRWTMKASIIIIISSFPPSIDKLSHSESGVYLPHIKGVLSISLLSPQYSPASPQTGHSCILITIREKETSQCHSSSIYTGNFSWTPAIAHTVPVTWIMTANLRHNPGWETNVIWALHW